MRLAGRGVFHRELPFALIQRYALPLCQHQLGLAHQGPQDQLKGDLELRVDIGGLHGTQELLDFAGGQRPAAGDGAVDVAHRQGHDWVGLDQTVGQRVVEQALEQSAHLAGGGVEALLLLAPDDAAHVLGGDALYRRVADVRQDVLFHVALWSRVMSLRWRD